MFHRDNLPPRSPNPRSLSLSAQGMNESFDAKNRDDSSASVSTMTRIQEINDLRKRAKMVIQNRSDRNLFHSQTSERNKHIGYTPNKRQETQNDTVSMSSIPSSNFNMSEQHIISFSDKENSNSFSPLSVNDKTQGEEMSMVMTENGNFPPLSSNYVSSSNFSDARQLSKFSRNDKGHISSPNDEKRSIMESVGSRSSMVSRDQCSHQNHIYNERENNSRQVGTCNVQSHSNSRQSGNRAEERVLDSWDIEESPISSRFQDRREFSRMEQQEQRDNSMLLQTPTKASYDNDDMSMSITDRNEKVKAIMDRVNKLKSTSSKGNADSYSEFKKMNDTSTVNHNFISEVGSNAIFVKKMESPMSMTDTIESKSTFETNPTLATNPTVSTFRAEMNKFKQKWHIADDETMETVSQPSRNMQPKYKTSFETTSIAQTIEEDHPAMNDNFKIAEFRQNSNASIEAMRKEIFELSRENLALKGKIQSMERRNDFMTREYESEMNDKKNYIAQLEEELESYREGNVSKRKDSYEEKVEKLKMKTKIERLENELLEKEKQISQLKVTSNNGLDNEKESPQQEGKTNNERNSPLHQVQEQNSKLQQENAFLKDLLEKNTSKSRDEMNDISTNASTNESEKKELKSRLRQMESKVAELEKKVFVKENELAALKSDFSKNDEKLKSQEDLDKLRLEGKITRQEKEIKTLQNDLDESKKVISSLQNKICNLEESLTDAENNVSNMNGMKAMLKESESFISHLQKDKELLIERNQAALMSVRKEMAEKERSAYHVENDLMKRIRGYEKERETLTNDMETKSKQSEDKIRALEFSLSNEEKNVSSLRSKSSDLSSNLEKKSRFILQLENNIEDLKNQLSDADREKSALDNEMKSLISNLEREKAKLSRKLELKLKESEAAIKSLEKASERKDKFVESLQDEIRRLSSSNTDVTHYQNENNHGHRKRGEHKNLVDFIEQELEDVRKQKAEIEMKLETTRKQMKSMNGNFDAKTKSLNEKLRTLANESLKKDKVILSLQNEIDELNQCIEGKILLSKNELERMETELSNAKQIIERDDDVKRVVANHHELQKSNTALKELVTVLREKIQELEEKLRVQFDETLELRGERDSCLTEYKEEINKLKIEAKEATSKKESAEAKLKENSKLLSKAESIMSKTNEASLSAVMKALSKKK